LKASTRSEDLPVVDYRKVGGSDLIVSLAGLGCNNIGYRIDEAASRQVVHRALDLGVTLFDTADMYGPDGASERMLGKLLAGRRNHVILATKFGKDEQHALKGASRAYVMLAVERSLKRLNTDWIDLYQVHAPDPLTPIEETLRALDDLVREGKVRYLGCSNFSARDVAEADDVATRTNLHRFICCQNEYSLLVRDIERELIPTLRSRGLGLLPYFPLASGMLTGKYMRHAPLPQGARLTKHKHLADRFMTDKNFVLLDRLAEFGRGRALSILDLAFAWLAAHPFIPSVIAGASTVEQLERNVEASARTLSPRDLAEIDSLVQAPAAAGSAAGSAAG
jgi:aryl-alcohol dehydrogenase-like predicted oxidoreductase